MFFDILVAFILLGLAVMGLQLVLIHLLKLRYRNLREALSTLVDGADVPKGFRSHTLVERALADPRIDPLSSGISGPDKAVQPASRVTWVDAARFADAVRDAAGRTSVTMMIDGLSVRPPAIQEEVKQEVGKVGDRIAAHVRTHFAATMTAFAERYKLTMRWLSVALGVPAAVAFGFLLHENSGLPDKPKADLLFSVMAVGAFAVPLLAAAWYGLLRNVAKLRPEAGTVGTPPARESGGSRPARRSSKSGGGKAGRSSSGQTGSSEEKPAASTGGGGGGARRRGRRSSGRRGGGRSGGGDAGGSENG